MPVLKLTGITSICAAGMVIQPDENGLVDVPAEVLASDDFIGVRSRLQAGQSIEGVAMTEVVDVPIQPDETVEPVKTAKKPKA